MYIGGPSTLRRYFSHCYPNAHGACEAQSGRSIHRTAVPSNVKVSSMYIDLVHELVTNQGDCDINQRTIKTLPLNCPIVLQTFREQSALIIVGPSVGRPFPRACFVFLASSIRTICWADLSWTIYGPTVTARVL